MCHFPIIDVELILAASNRPDVWGLISVLILIIIVYIAFVYPLFAITNDSFILWNYYGYASSEKYLLNELTRKEYEEASRGKDNHVVALYRGEKRIKKLYTNAYKNEKTLLELISQIHEKKEQLTKPLSIYI
ncbi:MAG: hypothetical protein IKA75_06495 [Bacteroidaceae bacterium]|nr:hypothetical protein [Bacteroidaceae bacterium]